MRAYAGHDPVDGDLDLDPHRALGERQRLGDLARRQPLLPVEQKHRAAAFGQIVYETAHQLLDFGLYQPAIGSVFAVGGGISVDQRDGNLLEREAAAARTGLLQIPVRLVARDDVEVGVDVFDPPQRDAGLPDGDEDVAHDLAAGLPVAQKIVGEPENAPVIEIIENPESVIVVLAYGNEDLYSVAPGDNTARLHRNREPRFYASIGFDRGTFEIDDKILTLQLRGGELHGSTLKETDEYQSCTGYLCQKWIHKSSTYNQSKNSYNYRKYAYPYLRLPELFYNYAEADFEYNGSLSPLSLEYLNRVRKRCGLPRFQDSWALVGGIPSGSELRKVLHQERSIEFLFEGRRFHDLRRWKEAPEVMNKEPRSWNRDGKTQEDFYQVIPANQGGRVRVFEAPKSYWLAIPMSQINKNPNLVQNPGY